MEQQQHCFSDSTPRAVKLKNRLQKSTKSLLSALELIYPLVNYAPIVGRLRNILTDQKIKIIFLVISKELNQNFPIFSFDFGTNDY